jgi:rhamnosyltransferase
MDLIRVREEGYSSEEYNVVAVIWTFNPDISRLKKVLESIELQVNHIIIVDNNSSNFDQIKNLIENYKWLDKVTLIKLKYNSGVRALNIGMQYAIETLKPEFILLLDDDTIVRQDAVNKVLNSIKRSKLNKRIGVACLYTCPGSKIGDLIIFSGPEMFSGCMVRSSLVENGLRIREDFFLDQADNDFYEEIRKLGYFTVCYREDLIEHRLGHSIKLPLRLPLVGSTYEPPWRYYYIVRNSTVLLLERKIDSRLYISQILHFGVPIIIVDGFKKFLRALGLGLLHGILRRLGIIRSDFHGSCIQCV